MPAGPRPGERSPPCAPRAPRTAVPGWTSAGAPPRAARPPGGDRAAGAGEVPLCPTCTWRGPPVRGGKTGRACVRRGQRRPAWSPAPSPGPAPAPPSTCRGFLADTRLVPVGGAAPPALADRWAEPRAGAPVSPARRLLAQGARLCCSLQGGSGAPLPQPLARPGGACAGQGLLFPRRSEQQRRAGVGLSPRPGRALGKGLSREAIRPLGEERGEAGLGPSAGFSSRCPLVRPLQSSGA